MSPNSDKPEHEQDEQTELTRRGAMAAGATAMPLAFWDDWSIFGGGDKAEILQILNAETAVAEGITTLDIGNNLSATKTSDTSVRIDAAIADDSGDDGSTGGSFEDTDDDGVAELQDEHADFQDGEARNLGALTGLASNPVTDLEGSNLSVDENGLLNAITGDGSGADPTATYVTTDDESTELENSQQHADLSGDDLHDPATHGDEAHDEIDAKTWDGYERQKNGTDGSGIINFKTE